MKHVTRINRHSGGLTAPRCIQRFLAVRKMAGSLAEWSLFFGHGMLIRLESLQRFHKLQMLELSIGDRR
jgi:hypothetical protein